MWVGARGTTCLTLWRIAMIVSSYIDGAGYEEGAGVDGECDEEGG